MRLYTHALIQMYITFSKTKYNSPSNNVQFFMRRQKKCHYEFKNIKNCKISGHYL